MSRSVVAISLVLAACAAPGPQMIARSVTLEVTPERVSAGGALTLILINRSAESLGYNLCSSSLERRAGATWELVPSNRICTMELRTLKPIERTEYPLKVPTTLSAGEYRYRTNVDWLESGTRSPVNSQPFQVR